MRGCVSKYFYKILIIMIKLEIAMDKVIKYSDNIVVTAIIWKTYFCFDLLNIDILFLLRKNIFERGKHFPVYQMCQ